MLETFFENSAPDRSRATPVLKLTVASVSGRLRAEQSNTYAGVIAVLAPGLRVIRCRSGIQWIIQARPAGRWRGIWFCRTKEALLRGAGQYASHPLLQKLPDTIEVSTHAANARYSNRRQNGETHNG